MGELFDTRQARRKDRMAFWLDTVCQQILPVKIDPRHDAQPEAAMGCRRLGNLAIREVVGGDHVYVRDDNDVRRGDPQTVQIGIPTGGSSILVQDGREAVLSAGDMMLYDSSRPFTLVMQDRFHWHVFLLPKHKLRRSDAELRTLTATPMRGDGGVSGVVSHFLLDLAARGREFEDQPTAGALGENAADLIGTLCRPSSADRGRLAIPSGRFGNRFFITSPPIITTRSSIRPGSRLLWASRSEACTRCSTGPSGR